jgi:hypothetical protein
MFRKHLLYLTNERLLSVIWRNGKTLAAESFAVDDAGQVAFANYLKRCAKLRAYFLVDLIEEDFRLDTIPHVRGSDRRELLDRKLNQMFRGTPFRHAIVLDRESAGRRDDRVLYTSITNAELLTPWLDLLDAERTPLVGIYSAPLLSPRLLKPLGQSAKHQLLVTIHQGNHLRQSYTHLGKTKFSRMTPMGNAFVNNRALAISEEVRKTWEYLESLRYFESGETLHVCVIADPTEFKESVGALAQQSGLSYEFVDIAKAAKSVGLTQPRPNSNAEWLLLHLLGRAAPKNHFARRELVHRAVIWRVKQTAIAAGAGALLLGTSFGSANFIDGKFTANQVLEIQKETTRIEQERQLVMRGLPDSSVAPDVMGRTVNFYNQTVQASPDFAHTVVALSRILVRFPHTELSDLAWATTADPSKPAANTATFGVDMPTQTVGDDAPNMTVDGRLYQVLILVATLDGVGQNQRQALDHIGSLKRAIETDLSAKVSILAQPLDPSASASLRGSAKPTQEKSNAAFALKIILPPPK